MLDFIMLFSLVMSLVALTVNQVSLMKRIEKAEEYIREAEEASGEKPDLDLFK